MQIVVFTRKNQSIPKFPKRSKLKFRHVIFESTDIDDLRLVALYRIINFPTSIIIDDNNKVLIKVKGSIPGEYVDMLSKK